MKKRLIFLVVIFTFLSMCSIKAQTSDIVYFATTHLSAINNKTGETLTKPKEIVLFSNDYAIAVTEDIYWEFTSDVVYPNPNDFSTFYLNAKDWRGVKCKVWLSKLENGIFLISIEYTKYTYVYTCTLIKKEKN